MKYTEEVLKLELIRLMGFTARQAENVVETCRCNGELSDLADFIQIKRDINGGSQ